MTEPIDFKQVIAEIEAAGISRYKLATMMHRQLTQVLRWVSGSEPRHHEGQMLLEIHAEHVTPVTVSSSKPKTEGV